jgi:hypothetical protein
MMFGHGVVNPILIVRTVRDDGDKRLWCMDIPIKN